ncbi:beta-galactoside alpha-2,6-sialyltransferase 2 [Trichonephila clavipes]|nr:beta-galactoside alpha-2,6-sialyltransferase 2 [Trichonephila clavipes]
MVPQKLKIKKRMKIPFLAISIWMFIFMTVFGVIGYAYVLWSQYWQSALEKKQSIMNSAHFVQEISLSETPSSNIVSNSQKNNNSDEVPLDKLNSKIHTYKNQLLIQLRKAQLVAGNVLFHKEKKETNIYKVKFKRQNVRIPQKNQHQLLCELKDKVRMEMLHRNMELFSKLGYDKYFPSEPVLKIFQKHHTCAIVSSSGSMYKSKLGKEIGKFTSFFSLSFITLFSLFCEYESLELQ